ncbi:protein ARV1 [Trypanosoma rangeli]|uniref:Protein ARV n=1 Tax=Trypanosoma rangeli TaxID=5698 RepID=A0A422P4H3_TRYRA|nr:protein ARV1 [Trypanosoma rangeli]RNF12611.1 protein ARV1 [Trypanosoma rangeli]|eukprot:RNF12611.1 protein ARV1 [Trypanosoma rangeli]
MPRCIECNSFVQRIVEPETEMVDKCVMCGKCCDKYYEFADVQKWLDVVLLERRAWIHVLYNQRDIFLSLFLAAVVCCMIEAYVVRITSVYADLRKNKFLFSATEERNLSREDSLQLVINLRSDILPLMMYPDTWPTLFLHACMEYFLCLVAAVWIGVQSQHGVASGQEDAMATWATSVSLTYTAKLGYVVFLVWRIPIPLVVVVDFVFLLWMVRGFSITASNHPSRLLGIVAVAVPLLARVLFRYFTGWGPQLIF